VGVRELSIPGLFLIERVTHRDDRGFFREVVRWDELEEAIGHEFQPVQWNHSVSEPGVLRALHAEGWNKLVYPITGRMFAVSEAGTVTSSAAMSCCGAPCEA